VTLAFNSAETIKPFGIVAVAPGNEASLDDCLARAGYLDDSKYRFWEA
jgi:hypothetical protein